MYTTETEMQISQPDEEFIEKTSKSLKLFRMNEYILAIKSFSLSFRYHSNNFNYSLSKEVPLVPPHLEKNVLTKKTMITQRRTGICCCHFLHKL